MKRVKFSYSQLMYALEGTTSKGLIAGIIISAIDSWRAGDINDYAFTTILHKASKQIHK